MQLNWCQPT